MELNLNNSSLENQVAFLKNLFDTIPYPIFVKNTKLEYIYANRICEEKNGFEPGGLNGKTDAELWEGKIQLVEEYNLDDFALISSKKGCKKLVPVITENEIFYSLLTKEPIFDENQNVIGILGLFSTLDLNISRRTLYNINGYDENDNCLLFDYVYDQNMFIVVKKLAGFDSFHKKKLTLDEIIAMKLIYEEDLYIIGDLFNSIDAGNKFYHGLIRLYDDNRNVVVCNFETSCFFEDGLNPSRIIGSIQPIKEEQIISEKIKIDIELVKDQLISMFGKSYDICMYINPDYKYYQILHAADLFADFDQSGDWNSFVEIMYERLHPSDYGVLKNIFQEVDDSLSAKELKRKREFRFLDKSEEYKWKAFEISKIETSEIGGYLLSFQDVTDAVLEREERTLTDMNNELIDVLSTVVEFRDTESGEHIARIKEFTRILLNQANKVYDDVEFSHEEIEIISNAAAMHDIGKIAISDKILLKNGKLTPEEFDEMKLHTIRGCDILEKMTNIQAQNYYKYGYEICRHHHERYDGKGYPDGLVGDEIPLESQIVSVADVFDALTSKRCYKPAYSCEKALDMINNGECGVFSEKMLECVNSAKKYLFECANRQYKIDV